MARAPVQAEDVSLPDALDGVPAPRETQAFVGHRAAEEALLEACRSGRIHHAWLFCGPRGVGKATLAFRLARFILAAPPPYPPGGVPHSSLAVPENHPAAIRIAAGAHPNVLHLHRPWDDKAKRFRSELSVDAVRRAIPFLGTTAGEGGWRVVVVDPADAMNRSAANALLKALEEPPPRVLFLLVAEAPGRLLPTILSRCCTLRFDRLSDSETEEVLAGLGAPLPPADRDLVLRLAEGSPRRALELLQGEGVALYRLLLSAIEGETCALAMLADAASDAAGGTFGRFLDLFAGYLARRARGQAEPAARHRPAALPLVTWAELWEKAARNSQEVETYNLDRRQFVLDLLETYRDAVRHAPPAGGR